GMANDVPRDVQRVVLPPDGPGEGDADRDAEVVVTTPRWVVGDAASGSGHVHGRITRDGSRPGAQGTRIVIGGPSRGSESQGGGEVAIAVHRQDRRGGVGREVADGRPDREDDDGGLGAIVGGGAARAATGQRLPAAAVVGHHVAAGGQELKGAVVLIIGRGDG